MRQVALLDAQAFHRNMPATFPYAPSQEALGRLGQGGMVCLRAMQVDKDGGGDLWESKVVWAAIESQDGDKFIGTVKTGCEYDGYREGDRVEFSDRHIFDFYGPDSSYNAERLPTLLGRSLLIGITVVTHEGEPVERQQLFGRIRGIERPFGLVVELSDGRLLDLPPTFSLLEEARPGEYRLRSSNIVVEDPDLVSVLTLSLAPGKTTWSGPRLA